MKIALSLWKVRVIEALSYQESTILIENPFGLVYASRSFPKGKL